MLKVIRTAATLAIAVFVLLPCSSRFLAALPEDHSAPPFDLRCEYLREPMAIDVVSPRFSWVLGFAGRGEAQSAYQILVASSRSLLDQDRGDQWDTGKVSSEETSQIAYKGKSLASG